MNKSTCIINLSLLYGSIGVAQTDLCENSMERLCSSYRSIHCIDDQWICVTNKDRITASQSSITNPSVKQNITSSLQLMAAPRWKILQFHEQCPWWSWATFWWTLPCVCTCREWVILFSTSKQWSFCKHINSIYFLIGVAGEAWIHLTTMSRLGLVLKTWQLARTCCLHLSITLLPWQTQVSGMMF